MSDTITSFDRFMNDLSQGETNLIKQLKLVKTKKAMIKILWSIKKFHRYPIPFFRRRKFHELAKESYEKAISTLAKPDPYYPLALKFLNQCMICLDVRHKDGLLPKTFAKRSELLCDMGQYKESFKEAHWARETGYIEDNILSRIKTKIQNKLAEETRDSPGEDLESEEDNYEIEADVTLSRCCKEQLRYLNVPREQLPATKKYAYLFNQDKGIVPDLKNANSNVPTLSKAANVGYSREKGRFIYATKDIYPGEVVSKETAYVFSPQQWSCRNICSFCAAVTTIPLGCFRCSSVVFCKEECKARAIQEYHQMECALLPTLLRESPRGVLALTLRMLFKTPFEELKKTFAIYRKEVMANIRKNTRGCDSAAYSYSVCMEKTKAKDKYKLIGCDEDGKYFSNDLRAIYHLATSINRFSEEDMTKLCFETLQLTKLVATMTTYLGKRKRLHPFMELDEDCLELALIIFRLRLVSFNYFDDLKAGHTIGSGGFRLTSSGGFVLSCHSLYNHSCDPNIVLCNYGKTNIARAIRFVPAGKELTICYNNSLSVTPEERRKKLQQIYLFYCMCEACVVGLVLTPIRRFTVLCPSCKNTVDEIRGCLNCNTNSFTIPPDFGTREKYVLTARGVYKLLRRLSRFKEFTLLSFTNVEKLRFAIALFGHFTGRLNFEQTKLEILLYFNYQIRANHIH